MISSAQTPSCGGSIQLVGLFQEGYGKPFGVIKGDYAYLLGHFLHKEIIPDNLDLRNYLFERCDSKTLELIEGAQAQPNELM